MTRFRGSPSPRRLLAEPHFSPSKCEFSAYQSCHFAETEGLQRLLFPLKLGSA